MKVDSDEYQEACAETAIYPKEDGVIYTMLGLGNEAGELQGKYEKYMRDNSSWEETKEKIIDELGDVLWYAAMLALELEVPLSLVMDRNIIKLQSRQARGTLGGSGDQRWPEKNNSHTVQSNYLHILKMSTMVKYLLTFCKHILRKFSLLHWQINLSMMK